MNDVSEVLVGSLYHGGKPPSVPPPLGGRPPPLGNDLLCGAAEIAQFLFGDSSQRQRRKVYYLAESDVLPIIRIGRVLYARKSTLRAWLDSLEQPARPEALPVGTLPSEGPDVWVEERPMGDGQEYWVFWIGLDGYQRGPRNFRARADADEYAAKRRCTLELELWERDRDRARDLYVAKPTPRAQNPQ